MIVSEDGDRRGRYLVAMVGGNIGRESRWEILEWWFVWSLGEIEVEETDHSRSLLVMFLDYLE